MSISRFLSNFLKVDSIKEPTTVTVQSVAVEEIGQEKEEKLVLYFKEFDQGLIPSKQVIRFLLASAKLTEAADLPELQKAIVNKQFVMYVDPNVYYGGNRVGGLRLREAA